MKDYSKNARKKEFFSRPASILRSFKLEYIYKEVETFTDNKICGKDEAIFANLLFVDILSSLNCLN